MYNCKLVNDTTETSVIFTLLENHADLVLIEQFDNKGLLDSTTVGPIEDGEKLKEKFLAEGFKEI
jgi:hypothetical protein